MEYNAIQTSRIERWIRKVLGVRNGGVLPTVAPELGAAINLPAYEDLDVIAGYRPWGGGHAIAAGGAGTFATMDLANLSTNWLLLVKLSASSNAPGQILVTQGAGFAGALIAASLVAWRDGRLLQSAFPLSATGIQISESVPAAAPPGAANFIWGNVNILARTEWRSPWFVVAPGQHVSVCQATANQDLYWSVEGYLRDVDPDELTA